MNRLALALAVLGCVVLVHPIAGGAQSPLPPCDAAHNGKLIRPELIVPQQRVGSKVLYATHRIRAKLCADAVDEAVRRELQPTPAASGSLRGPGRRSLGFVSNTPGPIRFHDLDRDGRSRSATTRSPTAGSEASRPRCGSPPRRACTRLSEADLSGADPRVSPDLRRPNADLRPVTGCAVARAARASWSTVGLADGGPAPGGYPFRKRFAGVTVRRQPRSSHRGTAS
jgi:hypothetical protein